MHKGYAWGEKMSHRACSAPLDDASDYAVILDVFLLMNTEVGKLGRKGTKDKEHIRERGKL